MDYKAATESRFKYDARIMFRRTGYRVDLDNYPFKRKNIFLYIDCINLWLIDDGGEHPHFKEDQEFQYYHQFTRELYRERTLEEYLTNHGYDVKKIDQ